MPRFLIDVNLPYYFKLWDNDHYIHQLDINDEAKDSDLWDYAKTNNLTIISKDSDFSHRILPHDPPPKVIHVKLGNMKMKEFFIKINAIWSNVLELNKDYKLVTIYVDRIEAIN